MSQYLIVNDEKYVYGFKSSNANEFACIACATCVDRLMDKCKGKMVNGCCEGFWSKGYGRYKCMLV